MLEEFRVFVRAWIRKKLNPLAFDSDVSVESWLAGSSYPAWRREELLFKWRRQHPDRVKTDPRFHTCKSFMKDESYVKYKHARAINSRSDEFKCLVGPIFKLIEKSLFKLKYFIKKVPVGDRPRYIYEMLYSAGGEYPATDFETFEASFVSEVMNCCEFELYDYMTSELNDHDWFMDVCHGVLAGDNVCKFKNFTVTVIGKRMSGEMCTSLGNSFTNLMVMKFAALRMVAKCKIVVEGDDSIGKFYGRLPSAEFFASIGFVVKLVPFAHLSEASFCGLVFDNEDLLNVTDPRVVLASFGWTTRQYMKANPMTRRMLLRSKALSLAYQYPGCPVLSALARYAMRMTRDIPNDRLSGFVAKVKNTYEREWLQEAIAHPVAYVNPPLNTRFLVEKLYGMSYSHQVEIENYLDGLNIITPLSLPTITLYMEPSWAHYWYNYVRVPHGDIIHPLGTWAQQEAYLLDNPLQ